MSCTENIKVFVRVRPLVGHELASQAVTQVSDDGASVRIDTETHNVSATFDHVFAPDATQEQIYDKVRFSAESVVSGLNSTIFAYGQTGSGKSFTMFGPEDDISIYAAAAPSESMGVIPRAIREVLHKVEQEQRRARGEEEPEELCVFCSFMQIYNDQPYDLLRDPQRQRPLQVHEDAARKEIFVVGLSEYVITSLHDCMALLEQGDEQRACRQTALNDVSSRSHSIFQMVVERRKKESGRVVRSKLNLVDLAGSEKWGIMDQLEKSHVSELTNINTSLHTLGRCIAALTDPEASHVPFRDSKLTRILMDALGGNSRTCVIATLSPSDRFVEESVSTLKFADRAKRVMQHARVVETREVSLELVQRLEREIEHLRHVLAQAGIDPSAIQQAGTIGKPSSDASADGEGGEQADELPQVKRKLFDARSKIAKLERENARLRGDDPPAPNQQSNQEGDSNSGSSSRNYEGAGAASEETGQGPSRGGLSAQDRAVLQALGAENKKLSNAVINMRACAGRFFRFEIEEEEFQQQFERLCPSIPRSSGEIASAAYVAGPKKKTSGGSGGASRGPVRANAAYRVRGKAGAKESAAEWTAPEAPEQKAKSLSSTLKEKQKELAKHKKLQQYLAEKAQRELDRIEADRQRDAASDKNSRTRDKHFRKHASLVKQRLLKMKDDERRYVEEERRLYEHDGGPRPESRASLLDKDTRPLSRQTIPEERI